MPQGLAARILGILDGLINPKSYIPAITRGELIKYDDNISFDGLNSVGPVDGLGNQFSVGGIIQGTTLYLQGTNNDLGSPRPGLMTTSSQTILGGKSFQSIFKIDGTYYAKNRIFSVASTSISINVGFGSNSTVYLFTNTGNIVVTLTNGGNGYNATFINAGGGTITFVPGTGAAIFSENGLVTNNVINTVVTATCISGLTNILLTGKLV